jgi:hypothetical protein
VWQGLAGRVILRSGQWPWPETWAPVDDRMSISRSGPFLARGELGEQCIEVALVLRRVVEPGDEIEGSAEITGMGGGVRAIGQR